MSSSVAIYQDDTLNRVGKLLKANKFHEIDFSNPDNMEAFILREYSRLHLNMKGQHVFSERDCVWASMDMLRTGQVIHTIFFIKHQDVPGFSGSSTIYRHDAMISYEGKNSVHEDKSTLKTKDSTVSANQLQSMPDFFFRPRFKGREATSHIAAVRELFRPSLGRIYRLLGSKIGLQ